jgi:putative phosphoesterase
VIRQLPKKKILEIGKFRIGVIHGEGHPDTLIDYVKEQFKGEKLDCVIYGHTHEPSIEKIDDTLYVNPGSPTDKVFAPYNSLVMMEIDDRIRAEIIRL